MKNYLAILFSCALGLTVLSACTVHQHTHDKHPHSHKKHKIHKSPRHDNHYGRVINIDMITVDPQTSGSGAVLGAIVGGVVGHQMGSGQGRDIATGVGVIGGALVGNEIEKQNEQAYEIYRITVSFDNGEFQHLDLEEIEDLQIGDRVKIENGSIDLL